MNGQSDQQTQVMQMVDTGDSVNVDDVFRTKRDAGHDTEDNTQNTRNSLSTLNTLTRYALMAVKPRGTQCLYRMLCLGNKRARKMKDANRYWLPLWQ